jgi:cyanuric acid amidohydrolase
MADADIDSIEDVHFVQIKCPLLTADRVKSAQERGAKTVTADTYESMGWSRAASALGVALKLEEVPVEHLNDDIINEDWSIFSSVASTSAGIELMNCEVMVLGNSASSLSDLVIAHSVMQDAIDGEAVREALSQAGVDVSTAATDIRQSGRIVQVLAKAEADPSGEVRGSRHTMLEDSDINNTRMARAVVAAVIASINGDTLNYVSGGAEHQGPAGGGPIAVIAQA